LTLITTTYVSVYGYEIKSTEVPSCPKRNLVQGFNPLKPKKREREEKVGGGGVATGTTFNGREEIKFRFVATKVPRQFPLVLLVKVGLVKVRHLEVGKVRWRVEQGEKLSGVLLRSYTILNFVISLGRAALGEVLMLIWGATFGRNFDVNIGRAA
jgi:hypothetical protein